MYAPEYAGLREALSGHELADVSNGESAFMPRFCLQAW